MKKAKRPRFKVGQVVILRDDDRQEPLRIARMEYDDSAGRFKGWFYWFSKHGYRGCGNAEFYLRPLTYREGGER